MRANAWDTKDWPRYNMWSREHLCVLLVLLFVLIRGEFCYCEKLAFSLLYWLYCWWFRNPKQPPGMYPKPCKQWDKLEWSGVSARGLLQLFLMLLWKSLYILSKWNVLLPCSTISSAPIPFYCQHLRNMRLFHLPLPQNRTLTTCRLIDRLITPLHGRK